MENMKYKGWNFIEQKWEDVTKEVYDTLLDPARCIVPIEKDNSIIESNKLIAEFMGVPFDDCDYTGDISMGGNAEAVRYHRDWGWLMPVVDKIEKLGYHTDIFHYSGDTMFIVEEGTPQGDGGKYSKCLVDICETTFNKISVVWQGVIQFIQWYNANQTKIK